MEVNTFFSQYCCLPFQYFYNISAFIWFHTAIHKDELDLDHNHHDRVKWYFYLGEFHASNPLLRISEGPVGDGSSVKEFIYILPGESLSKGWKELEKDDVFHFFEESTCMQIMAHN